MLAGRSCMLVFFPLIGTVLALVLGIIAVMAQSPSALGLEQVYFMRVDFTNMTDTALKTASKRSPEPIPVGQDGTTTSTGATSAESGSGSHNDGSKQDHEKAKIKDFYNAGVSGYCEGVYKDGVERILECNSDNTPFWFDLPSILDGETKSGTKVRLPADAQNYQNVLKASSQAAWICYVAGLVTIGIGFILGFWAFRSTVASSCTTFLAFAGFVLLFLASGISTGVYTTYARYFNASTNDYGIKATVDAKLYVLSWFATAAALWAFVWWSFSICCAPAVPPPQPPPPPYPEFADEKWPYSPPARYFMA